MMRRSAHYEEEWQERRTVAEDDEVTAADSACEKGEDQWEVDDSEVQDDERRYDRTYKKSQ